MKLICSLAFLFLISVTLHAQTWQWTHPEPNGNTNGDDDIVHVTAVDAQKNVYTLGDYNDTLYLNNVVRAVGQGSYVAKYDSLGNLIWYKLITTSPLSEVYGSINATDMVVNNNGIFLTGTFGEDDGETIYQIGDSTFGNYPDSAGEVALFFCKMDFSGNVAWNKTSYFAPPYQYYFYGGVGSIGSGYSEDDVRLSTDSNGNVFLAGWCTPGYDNQFTIGTDFIPIQPTPKSLSTNRSVYDMFIVKYNSAGNLVWSQYSFDSSTANTSTNLNSMICDGNGNLFIHATVNNNEKFGSITYKSFDKTDQYGDCLIKIPSAGGWSFVSELTTYSLDNYGPITAKQLACDNSNNIYAMVNVSGNNAVGATLLRKSITLPYSDDPQPYLVKMDNTGKVIWSKYFAATGIKLNGGSLDDYANGIYYSNNQLYITGSVRYGSYTTYLIFSKLTVPFIHSSNLGDLNYYVARCDTAGNFNWATNFGAGINTEGNAICTDGAGNIYTGGYYRVDVETLGDLNGSFKDPTNSTYNIFFGKLKDQYIHIDSVSSTAVCPGSNVSLPFHSFGLTFSSSNTFTAELSDSTGSFSNPKTIGSVKSTGTGSITATIPASFPYAHGYIVRIKSSDTLATGYPYYTYADTTYKITLLCPAPSSGFAATNIKSTSATLNWNPVSCGKGYKVQYRKTGTTAWKTVTVSTNIDSTVISGLTAATTYQWHVATKCANNQFSAYSIINTFTTAASLNEFEGTIAFTSKNALGLTVVPNPAPTNAVLVINGIVKDATVTILDVQGKPVWKTTGVTGSRVELPIEKLVSGVYVVQVLANKQMSVVRFVKE